jgi:hypothetical protein
MAYQDLFERLELKYLIDEVTAAAIRRAIAPHCEPDLFNGTVGRGYSIRSLYLDSPGLVCFRAKERGDHDRFKLRARTYDAYGQVHLEIKRKRGDVVWKERAAVPRESWAEAAQGWRAPHTKNPRALERFARLTAELGAEPRMMVDYEREAYASHHDGYARVTFDRHVMAGAADPAATGQDGDHTRHGLRSGAGAEVRAADAGLAARRDPRLSAEPRRLLQVQHRHAR